jgi:hypothetical protein
MAQNEHRRITCTSKHRDKPGAWPIVIGAVWDARGTEEIARALKGVDSDLGILQRRRPWDAVACERHERPSDGNYCRPGQARVENLSGPGTP